MKKTMLWDPYKDFQKTVLPNGLAIHSAYWDRPWVHMRFCVHSGSLQDPKGKNGLAHFVEHMLSSNSEKDENIIKKACGSATFGNTDAYRTDFSFKMPIEKKSINKALGIFGKMLNTVPDDCFLEKERSIILQEFYRKYPNKVAHEIQYRVFQNAYNGTRFEGFWGTLGIPETIKSISSEDIHKFFAEHYVPSNTSIIVAGGLKHDAVLDYIMKSEFSLRCGGRGRFVPKSILHIDFPKNNEVVIRMSELFNGLTMDNASMTVYVIIPDSFSYAVVRIFSEIWQDFLMHEIRNKKHATYDVELNFEKIGGCYDLMMHIMFNPTNLELVKKIVFFKSFKSLKKERIFREYKKNILRSYYVNDPNLHNFCMNAQRDLILFGRIVTLKEEMIKIEESSFEEYCDLIDYLSNLKRWWNLIRVP